MGDAVFTLIFIAFVVSLILIVWFVKRYKRCPSDKILVVYGKVGKGSAGTRTAKCIHGGAAFIWPVIQDFEFLDLSPITISVDLKKALSKQQIRVNVPCNFMVGISTEDGVMNNAAERLLGIRLEDIRILAEDIIIGQLRVVIATMTIEEINSNREMFLRNVSDSVEQELKKLGLKLINVNVKDITDESGYIDALGKKEAERAINKAKIEVAEEQKNGAIGEAKFRKEQSIEVAAQTAEAQIGVSESQKTQRIKVAAANSEAQVGEAETQKNQRISIAAANATAVSGENEAKIRVASSEAERRKAEAEANKIAVSAERINEAETQKSAYEAQKLAELARADREKATKTADIIIPAEIERQRIEIEAEAEAERIRRVAKGNADSIYYEMEAKAKGVMEILAKQAEGFNAMVKAAGDNPDDAVKMMIADKLVEIVKLQTEAVKNIKIDKVTVWDSLSNGKSSTANFMSGMLGALPPINDIFKSAGLELPSYLKGKATEEAAEKAAAAEPETAPTPETTDEVKG